MLYLCGTSYIHVERYIMLMWNVTLYSCRTLPYSHMEQYVIFMWNIILYSIERYIIFMWNITS